MANAGSLPVSPRSAFFPERDVDLAMILVEQRTKPVSDALLRDRLAKVAMQLPQEVFNTLEQGWFLGRTAQGKPKQQALTLVERKLVLASFAQLPLPNLRKFLSQQSKGELTQERRSTVLDILGAHGNASDIQSLLHWTIEGDSERRVPRVLRARFQAALTTILQRDEKAFAKTPELYRTANLSLVPGIVAALGSCRQAAAMTSLAEVLGSIPDADDLVLNELGHLAAKLREPIPEKAKDRVVFALRQANDSTISAAIFACGRLRCVSTIPSLIPMLHHEQSHLAKAAHVALQTISRRQLSNKAELWGPWYAEEVRWLEEDYARLLQQARHGLAGHATRALLEISKRRVFSDQLALDLLPCLQRPEKELIALTMSVMGHLQSYHAYEPMLELLATNQPLDIRKAAFDALCRLTGENHGDDPAAWKQANL